MSSNKPLVPTTVDMVKEVISNTETNKQQASQIKNKRSISNESNKGMAFKNQVHWINQGLLQELKQKTQ